MDARGRGARVVDLRAALAVVVVGAPRDVFVKELWIGGDEKEKKEGREVFAKRKKRRRG